MMSFIQQFYQDCLVKFALMGLCPDIPSFCFMDKGTGQTCA